MNFFGNKDLWKDYLAWGLAFGSLLSLVDYAHDGYAQVGLFLAFFLFTGIIDNAIYLAGFVRKYPYLLIATIIWKIYYNIRVTNPISNRMPIVMFVLIYSGYRIAKGGEKYLESALSKLCIFIGVAIVFGIIWQITGINGVVPYFKMAEVYHQFYWQRLSSIFMQPVPAGSIFLVYTLICFLFIEDRYVRYISFFLGIVAVWLSSTRSAMIILASLLLYDYIFSKKMSKQKDDIPKTSRFDRWVAVGGGAVTIVVLFLLRNKLINALSVFIYRLQTFNRSEAGIAYRIDAWTTIIDAIPNGTWIELLFGRGMLQGYYYIASFKPMVDMYGVNAGPVENMFINVLYDFGLLGFALFVSLTFVVLKALFDKEHETKRKIAIVLISLIGMSATYDLEYWLNTAFLIFTLIGLFLGVVDYDNEAAKKKNLRICKPLKVAMLGQKNAMTNEGGVEVVARELALRLIQNGEDVTCYNRKAHHVSGSEFDVPEVDEYDGIEMKYVPTIEKKGFAALTSSFGAAVAAACGDYDVVHVHAEGPAFFCWIPKLTGKRVICQIHGLDHQRVKWGKVAKQLILWGEENAVKYADAVLVLSRNVQNYFKDTYGRDTVYVPNAVNEPSIVDANVIFDKWGLNKDSYILFLGRMVPEKGIEYLIRAYKEIDTEKKLVIAGGSSDTQKFVNEMKELAKDDERIIFTGYVEGQERAELYSNAYVYVLPSDIEGMPLSLLEAMSYGNCCLVSDIDECTEVVEDKAVTFRHGDKESLQEELATLLSDDQLVGIYKSSAKEFVCDKYNWDSIVENVEKIYRGSLEE